MGTVRYFLLEESMDQNELLEIIVLAEDDAVARSLEELSDDAFTRESSGFDGVDTVIVAFSSLSVPLLGCITKIVIEQIRARRHVEIRHGKTVVKGISEGKATEFLELLTRNAKK